MTPATTQVAFPATRGDDTTQEAEIGTGDSKARRSAARASTDAPTVPDDDDAESPLESRLDVGRLAAHVNDRLRELGLSQLAASKLGFVSRATLNLLGKDDRVPSRSTLEKLDDLLSWEWGTSYAVMLGAEPVPRETNAGARHPAINDDAEDDFNNLARWIDKRLRELNMSKSRFSEVGGPGRTTMATMGRSGYKPTLETLERIDTHLMWQPGSALAALKGGVPINRGGVAAPHPALVPLSALRDRLKVLKARAQRQRVMLDQFMADIDDAMSHLDLVVSDLSDSRRRMVPSSDAAGSDDDDVDAVNGERAES